MKPSPEAIEAARLVGENTWDKAPEIIQAAIDAAIKELRQEVEEMNNYVKQVAEKLQSRPAQEWRITEAGESPDAGWYLHIGSGEPLLFDAAQLEKLEAIVRAHNRQEGETCPNCGRLLSECHGNCIFEPQGAGAADKEHGCTCNRKNRGAEQHSSICLLAQRLPVAATDKLREIAEKYRWFARWDGVTGIVATPDGNYKAHCWEYAKALAKYHNDEVTRAMQEWGEIATGKEREFREKLRNKFHRKCDELQQLRQQLEDKNK